MCAGVLISTRRRLWLYAAAPPVAAALDVACALATPIGEGTLLLALTFVLLLVILVNTVRPGGEQSASAWMKVR